MTNPTRDQIEAHIAACCAKYGVPVDMAMRQCQTESAFNVDAKSPVGCYGLFQLAKGTAADLKVDRFNWRQNVDGGIRYDAQLFRRFGAWDKALAAYNWGMGNLKTCIHTHGAEWRKHLPRETSNYLRKILGA